MPTRRSFLNLCIALGLGSRAHAEGADGVADEADGLAEPAGTEPAGTSADAAGTSADAADTGATTPALVWREIALEGDEPWARRALVGYPAPSGAHPSQAAPSGAHPATSHPAPSAGHPAPGGASPAPDGAGKTHPGLLLFHGRGETSGISVALNAWRERYGLEQSHARLRRPPIALSRAERRYIHPEQLEAIEARLAKKPYAGLCVICPVTPNPHRSRKPERVLDRYSEWIEHTLLPAVRAAAPLDMERGVGVDGCSMGGFVAAEVFARKPHLFRSFGVVQPAFGEFRVARYARHLGQAMKQDALLGIHLQTSTRDPYRGAVSALARQLKRQGARFTLDVLPGPHDQAWLRAAGTMAMLAWHDYTLG